MIDLHLHFDGSLLPRMVLELADEQGIELPAREPDELKLFLTAPADCESLNEYLEKFDLPLLVLQTKEAIRKGMYTLASSLKEQGDSFCTPASYQKGAHTGPGGESCHPGAAGGPGRLVF